MSGLSASWAFGSDGPGQAAEPFGQMLARRSLWLRGPLDHTSASRLCAELMILDNAAAHPIDLIINSSGGPVEAALAIIDTLDVVGSPVATLCLGQAVGAAAAVLACGRASRRVTPTARISLRLAPSDASGTASALRAHADNLLMMRDQLALRLAAATGQLPALIVLDLDDGGFMTAEQAVAYGLVDEIATRR